MKIKKNKARRQKEKEKKNRMKKKMEKKKRRRGLQPENIRLGITQQLRNATPSKFFKGRFPLP